MGMPHSPLEPLNRTELKDRTLWFDGDSSYNEDQLLERLGRGEKVNGCYTDEITPELRTFNRSFGEDPIRLKKSCRDRFDMKWNIPTDYREFDVYEYLSYRFEEDTAEMSDQDMGVRAQRFIDEYEAFVEQGLIEFLRTLIYVINTLEEKDIVWAGRGSSVSSYILYLVGVHDVDPIKYDLDYREFLR